MKELGSILTEISELTYTIASDYPELYRFLDENPITLPAVSQPEVNKKVLQEYLESLEQLLARYIKTHKED